MELMTSPETDLAFSFPVFGWRFPMITFDAQTLGGETWWPALERWHPKKHPKKARRLFHASHGQSMR